MKREGSHAFKKQRERSCLYNEALALFFMGVYDHSNLEVDSALPKLTKILTDRPNDREACNLRGLIHLKLQKFEEAKKDFSHSLNKLNAQNDVYICLLYAQSQLSPQAAEQQESKETEQLSQADCYAYILKHIKIPCLEGIFTNEMLCIHATVLCAKGKYEDAAKQAEAAFDRTPKNPSAYQEQVRILTLLKSIYEQWQRSPISDDGRCIKQLLFLLEVNHKHKLR